MLAAGLESGGGDRKKANTVNQNQNQKFNCTLFAVVLRVEGHGRHARPLLNEEAPVLVVVEPTSISL